MGRRYAHPRSPFNPNNREAYLHWREFKLESAPFNLEQLVVEVQDPRQLSETEHSELLSRIRRANMAIYAGQTGDDPDKAIPHALGRQFGLHRLDHNWLADDDGITSLSVNEEWDHPGYIPYTNRPIQWHTDGYYNPMHKQVHGLILHCVQSAASGGENRLMDHEMAYLHLRDTDPNYITALMQPDVMTIPPGTDMHGNRREASIGPVFSIDPDSGELHMRYTARRNNIRWKADTATREALSALEGFLRSDSEFIYRGRLEPGMGLISNNVLHDRAGFEDAVQGPARLLYRARYFDRINPPIPST